MSWVTVIWSMVASACLTLAAVHWLGWCQRRSQWAYLLFAIAAAGTAGVSAVELWMMHAATPAQFAAAVRWLHVPMWAVFVALVAIVRVYLRAGRPWLAWTVCALRTLCLPLDVLTGQNLNYLEITRLRPVPFLGEFVSVAEGAPNPWMLVGQLSLYLFVIFSADAAVTVWRRGDRSRAMTMGGSIVLFMLAGGVHSAFYVRAVTDAPFFASLYFLGVVAAMGWELSREAIRATQLGDDLRESEARYQSIFDGAVEGMFRTSASGKVLLANAAMADMLGYGSADELTRGVEDTARQVWADPEERDRYVQLLAERGAGRAYECQFKRKDGTRVWVSLSTRVSFVHDGRTPAYFDGFVMDIGERKQAEESINENQMRCAMGADLAGLGFYELADGENVRYLDDRVRAICGFPSDIKRGASILKFWLEHIHRDDFLRMQDVHLQLFDGRRDRSAVEYRYRHPDKGEVWIHHVAMVAGRNDAGQRIREIGVMRDITPEKRAEIERAESEERLRQAAEAAGFGVYQFDLLSGQVFYSPEFMALYGLPAHAALDLDSDMVPKQIHPDDKASFMAGMREANNPQGTGILDVEFRIFPSPGNVRWLRAHGRTVFEGDGPACRPVRANGVILDITQRKQTEVESLRNRSEIAHLSRVASMGELVSSLAHELNQPLTAIQTNAQAAQRLMASGRPDLGDIRDHYCPVKKPGKYC